MFTIFYRLDYFRFYRKCYRFTLLINTRYLLFKLPVISGKATAVGVPVYTGKPGFNHDYYFPGIAGKSRGINYG